MNTIRQAILAAVLASVALAGCGLKGPLTVPEKSGNVVIREKQTGGTAPAAEQPATTAEPAKRPPPELPRSENSTGRGS
jgi:predicted small lipoprotein YifL